MLLLLIACFSSYNPEFDVEKISNGEIAQPEETYTEPDLDGDGYGLLEGDCDELVMQLAEALGSVIFRVGAGD